MMSISEYLPNVTCEMIATLILHQKVNHRACCPVVVFKRVIRPLWVGLGEVFWPNHPRHEGLDCCSSGMSCRMLGICIPTLIRCLLRSSHSQAEIGSVYSRRQFRLIFDFELADDLLQLFSFSRKLVGGSGSLLGTLCALLRDCSD